MKRGKRFIENNKLYTYIGTAIFVLLAIALGIIMYMTNRTATKIENETGKVVQENQVDNNTLNNANNDTENASTEMGKTVEEQQKVEEEEKKNSQKSNTSSDNNMVNVTTDNSSNKNNTNKSSKSSNSSNSSNSNESKLSTPQIDEPDTDSPAPTKSPEKKEMSFTKPTDGEIICGYAKENLIYSDTLKEWITHTAIDIKADKTSVIKSAADGIVKSIITDPRYGLTVIIEHDDGYETVYSNLLTAEFVVEGEEVTQGQTIATAGNTASFESSMDCHLHFELLKDGEYLDPSIYLK